MRVGLPAQVLFAIFRRAPNTCAQPGKFEADEWPISKSVKHSIHRRLVDRLKELTHIDLDQPPRAYVLTCAVDNGCISMVRVAAAMRHCMLQNEAVYPALRDHQHAIRHTNRPVTSPSFVDLKHSVVLAPTGRDAS